MWYQNDRYNVVSKFKRSVQELNHENFHDLVKPFSILIIDQSQDD